MILNIQKYQQKFSKISINIFIFVIGLMFIKVIYNISVKSMPFSWTDIFSLTSLYAIIFILSLFFILFHIGKQIKQIANFKYTTTGIVAFFAITFLINIILSFLGLSSSILESISLYVVTFAIFSLRFFMLKGKFRLSFCIGLILSFIVFYLLPKEAFPFRIWFSGSWDHGLHDISYLWFPSSAIYFKDGLTSIIQNHPQPGYGLFLQHIIISMKRLIFFNSNTIDVYYFAHYTSFALAIYWLIELPIIKKIKILIVTTFVLVMLVHKWILTLFFISMMQDGLAALLLGIIMIEVFSKMCKSADEKENNIDIFQNIFFWIVAGTVYLSKPMASYLVMLFPICLIFKDKFFKQDFKNKVRIILPAVFIFLPAFFWTKLCAYLNTDTDYFHVSRNILDILTLTGFRPEAVSHILNYWFRDKMMFVFAFGCIPYIFLGFRNKIKTETIACLSLIFINLVCVFGLYMTVWGGTVYDDAFRYFIHIFYVSFFLLAIVLNNIQTTINERK